MPIGAGLCGNPQIEKQKMRATPMKNLFSFMILMIVSVDSFPRELRGYFDLISCDFVVCGSHNHETTQKRARNTPINWNLR